MSLPYPVPVVSDNDDAWGPCSVPEHLKDMPFAPFSKGDKLGRAADWTQQAYQKYQGRYQQAQGAPVFNFVHNEEEDSFHLVDNRPTKTTRPFGQRRFQQNRFQQQRRERERAGDDGGDKKKQPAQKRNPWQYGGREQQRLVQYSSSVDIRPEWAVQEQIPFPTLQKLSCAVGEPTDLVSAGELEYYDKAYDRITARAEKALERSKRTFRSVSTSDDPIIRRLAAEGTGRVFATDAILTALMCVRSSVYSWDVIITRTGNQLFLDKRDGGPLDMLTVHETAPEQVPEDPDNINGVQQLALEATVANQNLSQQLLVKDGNKYKLDEPNPFSSPDDKEELASAGYRYRKWTLNAEDNLDIVVRCELEGVTNNKGEDQLIAIKALNEFDLKATDWRKKLESQRGAVLAIDLKNNKNKVARWTAAALLSGAELVKIGYVSRAVPRDNQNHIILGTQAVKPRDFAAQINLSMDHCWGVVRALVEMLMKLDEGKYLLVKDPNKELLRLYAVPPDAFDANYTEEPVEDDVAPAPAEAAAAAADEE